MFSSFAFLQDIILNGNNNELYGLNVMIFSTMALTSSFSIHLSNSGKKLSITTTVLDFTSIRYFFICL